MTTPWIEMTVEGLVAVLLVVTIAYCALLDRRLKRLRADEANLRATISELLTATEIAERAIVGLKETASDCDKTLAQRLREAEFFSQEIEKEIGEGERLLNRIIRITQAGQSAMAEAAAPVAQSSAPSSSTLSAPAVAAAARTPSVPAKPVDPARMRAQRLGELRAQVDQATDRLGQLKARGAAA